MNMFWTIWIFVLTSVFLALILWVLLANRRVALRDDEDPENRTTGHVYDGIEEFDNPLPKWWFQLFVGSLIFAVLYLIWFPGVWPGIGGWTAERELKADQAFADERYSQNYQTLFNTPVEELIHDAAAMKMGVRLFSNNCAVCHGSDGGGNFGIPNLTDKDSLYGSTPEAIKNTLVNGRAGNMPAWGAILGEEKTSQVTDYVLKLSGQAHDAAFAEVGEQVFAQNCAACHGADGTGMKALGAPNLTDDIWLYDGSKEGIYQVILGGLQNMMPAQKELLREEKIHILTAYVYSLSYDYEQ